MHKKTTSILMALAIVMTITGLAFAWGDGNGRKGKFLYRKNCRTCHGASASDLSPSDRTQAEWTKIFENIETIPCHGDWPEMPESDINDTFTYLHDYAKDSPSPAKCS